MALYVSIASIDYMNIPIVTMTDHPLDPPPDKPANPNRRPPSGDRKEPFLNVPAVTKYLTLANITIFFLLTLTLDHDALYSTVMQYGVVPARITDGQLDQFIGLITHMFLHADTTHLFINVTMLLAFGSGIERSIGSINMLKFYFLTGVIGMIAHIIAMPGSTMPAIGASGAISGLFGGILRVMQVRGLMPRGWTGLLPIVAVLVGINVLIGTIPMPIMTGGDAQIAWAAHVGGFLAGVFLFPLFVPRKKKMG
jgi:membrane associated rhomboid family serine protease